MPEHGHPEPLDNSHARGLFAISIFFPCLATAAVAGRFYARRLKGLRLSVDDWMILLGLIFFYLEAIASLVGIFLGFIGHHIEDLSIEEAIIAYKVSTWSQYTYSFTMGLTRSSICLLFIRIFITRTFGRIAYAVLIFNIAWLIYSLFYISLRCIPFDKNWDRTRKAGHCARVNPFMTTVAAWGVLSDAIIWSLPIPMVLRLHLPLVHRLSLCGVFALGILDIIVSIVRVVSTLKIDFEDFTWSGVSAIEWALVEPGIAILVASSLVLRPVVDKLIHRCKLPRKIRKKGNYSNIEKGIKVQPHDAAIDDQMELVHSRSDAVDTVDAGVRELHT